MMPTALPTGINCRSSSAHVRCHPSDRASTIASSTAAPRRTPRLACVSCIGSPLIFCFLSPATPLLCAAAAGFIGVKFARLATSPARLSRRRFCAAGKIFRSEAPALGHLPRFLRCSPTRSYVIVEGKGREAMKGTTRLLALCGVLTALAWCCCVWGASSPLPCIPAHSWLHRPAAGALPPTVRMVLLWGHRPAGSAAVPG